MRTAICILGLILLGAAATAGARELYVSPTGKPGASGTRAAPLDLYSVLAARAPVKPGDTVWLLEGTYPAPVEKGKRVAFTSRLAGTKDQPIILRAEPGKRVTLDGWMVIQGRDTWYWGFEVGDSHYTDKTSAGLKRAGTGTGVNVFGPRTKFINLDVHDGAMGFGFWSPAVDAEIYGCIIHDFGFGDPGRGRGHGHAIYTQNETGTKRIVDNVMFNGFGWNLHVYTQQGQVKGYHIEGNISFSPGMRINDPPKDNYLLCAYQPLDRITFINNVAYHPETGGWRPNVRLSTYKKKNIAGVCKGNYIMGLKGLQVQQWQRMEISGNTVWAPETLLAVGAAEGDKWVVDGNTYIAPADRKGFNDKTFAEYRKATGFDANSRLIEAERPTENFIFVRPNRYEPGRGHVAVFNWENKDPVTVDLSAVLKKGARFVVHNVQDLYGKPVAEGTFDGNPVTLPMLKSKIAPDFDAFLVTSLTE